jgi:putative sigma-54 modulation protein
VQILVTGRNVAVPDALKSYAEKKASKLLKYYDRIQAIDVVLDHDSGQNRAEMIVEAEHRNTFVARESHDDMYAAIDLVVDKLERQLTRHKERFRNRKHQGRGIDKTGET